MSGREKGVASGLDLVSRQVLARFCVELCWFGAIAAASVLGGFTTRPAAVAAFGTYCSFAALIRTFVAARRHERPCAATLNSWDECLGLTAVAMLAYAVARMLEVAA